MIVNNSRRRRQPRLGKEIAFELARHHNSVAVNDYYESPPTFEESVAARVA